VTAVLVDSNVLLDIATDDPTWSDWSAAMLERLGEEAVLVINALVYAEVSIGFPTIERLEAALPTDLFRREHLPYEAAFLAGKCFWSIAATAARRDHLSQTSTSGPTRRWPATGS
jgi:hypothetical protein